MKLSWVFRCNFLLVLFCALPLAAQPANLCGTPKSLPTGVRPCSFTGRNGDCTIVIDRLRPLSPPLINARRGAYIKVQIADPSPFEDLTFDLKSATSVVPVDPFSSAFTTLLGAAKTIEVIGVIGQRTPINSTEAQKISMQQSDLLTAIQASLDQFPAAMNLIIPATQPPPGNVCFKSKEDALPWIDLADWKTEAEAALDKVLTVTIGHNAPMAGPKDVKSQIYSIQYQIDNLRTTQLTPKDPSPNATADEKTQLTNGQKPLTDALALLNKVQALRKVGDGIIPKPEPTFTIVDLQAERTGKKVTKPIDKNDQNEQWQISFVNTFLQDVNSALADPVTDPITRAQNALKNASTPKTSVAAITANYQTAPGIEVSSGLMVPMQPWLGHRLCGSGVAHLHRYTRRPVELRRSRLGCASSARRLLWHHRGRVQSRHQQRRVWRRPLHILEVHRLQRTGRHWTRHPAG